jgi:hypothetical protein
MIITPESDFNWQDKTINCIAYQDNSSSASVAPYLALSNTSTIPSDFDLITNRVSRVNTSGSDRAPVTRFADKILDSMTEYFMITTAGTGAGTILTGMYANHDTGNDIYSAFVLRARFGYV